jgi:hypothetical protein
VEALSNIFPLNRKGHIVSLVFLNECAQEAWEALAIETLNKLAEGMQKRVEAVMAAGS